MPCEIGPDPAPRRQPQGGRQFPVACCLIGSGQRLVGEILANGVLGKAAADGKCGPSAAPFVAGSGQGKGGIIDIAEPDTVIENGVDRARDLDLFMASSLRMANLCSTSRNRWREAL